MGRALRVNQHGSQQNTRLNGDGTHYRAAEWSGGLLVLTGWGSFHLTPSSLKETTQTPRPFNVQSADAVRVAAVHKTVSGNMVHVVEMEKKNQYLL